MDSPIRSEKWLSINQEGRSIWLHVYSYDVVYSYPLHDTHIHDSCISPHINILVCLTYCVYSQPSRYTAAGGLRPETDIPGLWLTGQVGKLLHCTALHCTALHWTSLGLADRAGCLQLNWPTRSCPLVLSFLSPATRPSPSLCSAYSLLCPTHTPLSPSLPLCTGHRDEWFRRGTQRRSLDGPWCAGLRPVWPAGVRHEYYYRHEEGSLGLWVQVPWWLKLLMLWCGWTDVDWCRGVGSACPP